MSEEHCTTCEDREEITSGKMQLDFNGFYIFLLVTAASENKERKKSTKIWSFALLSIYFAVNRFHSVYAMTRFIVYSNAHFASSHEKQQQQKKPPDERIISVSLLF